MAFSFTQSRIIEMEFSIRIFVSKYYLTIRCYKALHNLWRTFI
ncbi:hypothetical protein X975_24233, partial [Stegodyphus mimosarum]